MDISNSLTAPTAETTALADTLSARFALVATTCCVCAAALADATSVELGIGPTCRRKAAKLDKELEGTPIDWDHVADALGEFAAINPNDTDRINLFENAMAQIAIARTGAAHTLANLITHYIAATQARPDSISGLVVALERMGRPNLAAALRKRQYPLRVEEVGGYLRAFTPFAESFKTEMWHAGGRWDRDLKCYAIPADRGGRLRKALSKCYPGTRGMGPSGEFIA